MKKLNGGKLIGGVMKNWPKGGTWHPAFIQGSNSEFAREGNRHNSMLMTEAKLPGKAYIKIPVAMKKNWPVCR